MSRSFSRPHSIFEYFARASSGQIIRHNPAPDERCSTKVDEDAGNPLRLGSPRLLFVTERRLNTRLVRSSKVVSRQSLAERGRYLSKSASTTYAPRSPSTCTK